MQMKHHIVGCLNDPFTSFQPFFAHGLQLRYTSNDKTEAKHQLLETSNDKLEARIGFLDANRLFVFKKQKNIKSNYELSR